MVLGALFFLAAYGGRGLRRQIPRPDSSLSYPKASVIIPASGASASMKQAVLSIIQSDYPDCEYIFAVRDKDDPAYTMLSEIIAAHSQAAALKLVTAGSARRCGQKNHNILAALEHTSPGTDVYVFFDANHIAPPDLLKRIVAPIAAGSTEITTGYHQICPRSFSIPVLGKAVTVLVLFLLQQIPAVTQPWGGATAVTADLFFRLGTADHWADTVVDDVSFAALLQRNKIVPTPTPDACFLTDAKAETFSGWLIWQKRQWLYLKFCFPGTWIAVGIFFFTAAGGVVASFASLVLVALGMVSVYYGFFGGLVVGGLVLFSLFLRRHHPRPGPRRLWPVAFFAALFAAVCCHIRTWPARSIAWRNNVYKVGRNGRVLEIGDRSDG